MPYEHDNLLDTLVTITILTIIFCLIGGYVEMSNMFDKPNQDDSAEQIAQLLAS